jgi:hypothetical protein
MMKPGKTFKLSKPTKTMLALGGFRNQEDRNRWKRAMIDAELCAAVQPKREKRPSGPQGNTQ